MSITLLSHPLNDHTPSYGNRDRVKINPKSQIKAGDTSNSSELVLTSNHIGTHVDLPKHFYDDGLTITDIEPDQWVFNQVVLLDVACEEARLIDKLDFESKGIPADTDMLLIRTGFERKRFADVYWNSYPGISERACRYLRETFPRLRAVVLDFISLTSPHFKDEGKKAHRELLKLKNGSFVLIIEDARLDHIMDAPSRVFAIPLLLENGDGGPITLFAEMR